MNRKWWAVIAAAVLVLGGAALAVFLVARDSDNESSPTATTTTGPAEAAPIAPAGSAPSPSSPSEQEAANAAVAAHWTQEKILRALQHPDTSSPTTRQKSGQPSASAAAPSTEGGQTEPATGTDEAKASEVATRRACKQPRLRRADPDFPYSRYCYRGSLRAPPARVVGQLIYEKPPKGEEFVCTASVAGTSNAETPGNSSVLVSAGHCIGIPARGSDESSGQWQPVSNMFFAPSLILQAWLKGKKSETWLSERSWYPLVYSGTHNPVGFIPTAWKNQGSYPYDFSAIVVGRRDFGSGPVAIGDRLGGLAVSMLGKGANRRVRSLGYPIGPPFKGFRLFECAASSASARGELVMGCDMTGGSSGGPWLADTNGNGDLEIVSVNSNGPPNLMFGPNLSGIHWPSFDAARKT